MSPSFHRLRFAPVVRFLGAFLAALAATTTRAAESPLTILFLGDSLTAGFGLTPDEAFPALVEARLRAEGLAVEVINGGLSGETSAGGLRRVRWVLRRPVDLLVLALGANDGLRGLSPAETAANLQSIIDTARELQPDIRILLAGMLAPPNMGAAYSAAFGDLYPALAEKNGVPLLPFLLEGVAGEPSLNQADGIHPNVQGHQRIADQVVAALRPLVDLSDPEKH